MRLCNNNMQGSWSKGKLVSRDRNVKCGTLLHMSTFNGTSNPAILISRNTDTSEDRLGQTRHRHPLYFDCCLAKHIKIPIAAPQFFHIVSVVLKMERTSSKGRISSVFVLLSTTTRNHVVESVLCFCCARSYCHILV